MFSNIFFLVFEKISKKKLFFCLLFIIKRLHLQNQIVKVIFKL